MARSEVKAFADFYMEHGPALTEEVVYISSDATVYSANKDLLK